MGLWRRLQGADLPRNMRPVITMNSLKPNRSERTILAAPLVGLGLIVFLCGFGYKISLYLPLLAPSHSLLRAKAIPEQASLSEIQDETQKPNLKHARKTLLVPLATTDTWLIDFSGHSAEACLLLWPDKARSVLRRFALSPLPIFRPPPTSV